MQVEKNKSKIQFSIRWKIIIGFSTIFTFMYVLALYFFTSFAISATDDQIKVDLTQALNGAAAGINVDDLIELAATGLPNEEGFSDDPRFIEMINWLDAIHAGEPDAWPYLYVPGDEPDHIKFVVDLWALYDASVAAGFMEDYKSNSGFIIEGLSNQTYRAVDHQFVQSIRNFAVQYLEEVQPKLFDGLNHFATWLTTTNIFPQEEFGTYGDQFGRWASGYRPLKNSSGEMVAAIGVDFIADTVNEIRSNVSDQIKKMFLLAYPILLIIAFIIANIFTKPLITLSSFAEKIGEGNYDVDFSKLTSKKYRDEINSLAEIFEIMVGKVQKREQILMSRPVKIEIDKRLLEAEVSEIVNTEFFRDLKIKSAEIKLERR